MNILGNGYSVQYVHELCEKFKCIVTQSGLQESYTFQENISEKAFSLTFFIRKAKARTVFAMDKENIHLLQAYLNEKEKFLLPVNYTQETILCSERILSSSSLRGQQDTYLEAIKKIILSNQEKNFFITTESGTVIRFSKRRSGSIPVYTIPTKQLPILLAHLSKENPNIKIPLQQNEAFITCEALEIEQTLDNQKIVDTLVQKFIQTATYVPNTISFTAGKMGNAICLYERWNPAKKEKDLAIRTSDLPRIKKYLIGLWQQRRHSQTNINQTDEINCDIEIQKDFLYSKHLLSAISTMAIYRDSKDQPTFIIGSLDGKINTYQFNNTIKNYDQINKSKQQNGMIYDITTFKDTVFALQNGDVFIAPVGNLSSEIRIHQKDSIPICIAGYQAGFITASVNGTINIYKANPNSEEKNPYQHIFSFDSKKHDINFLSVISEDHFIIGTTSGELLIFNFQQIQQENFTPQILKEGHQESRILFTSKISPNLFLQLDKYAGIFLQFLVDDETSNPNEYALNKKIQSFIISDPSRMINKLNGCKLIAAEAKKDSIICYFTDFIECHRLLLKDALEMHR